MTRVAVLSVAAALFAVQTAALLPLTFTARVVVGLGAVGLCMFGLWHGVAVGAAGAPSTAPTRVDLANRPRLPGLDGAGVTPPPNVDPITGEIRPPAEPTAQALERLEARCDDLRRDVATLRTQLADQAQLFADRLAQLEAQL